MKTTMIPSIQMLLAVTSRRLARLPDSDVMLQRVQQEYEILLAKINAFSKARKQWLDANRAAIMGGYDVAALKKKTKMLRTVFLEQKKHWLMLNARIA